MAFGAAHQGPDGPSTLYTIDLNTGFAAPIGPIGFERVSGMDIHPQTGILYATAERADGSNTGVLITIDPLTGVGEEIGPFVAEQSAVGLSFRSDGALFGYGFGFQTATINTVTGEATLVGQDPVFLDSRGFGTAFSPADVLYTASTFFGDAGLSDDVYTLSTLDQTTGSELTATSLTYSQPVDTLPRINAMDFHPGTGVLFASINDGVAGAPENHVGTVNLSTGVVCVNGPTVDGLDAIAFTPGPVP
jgi:hypothetical protein